MAKISVLFLVGVFFCIISTMATALCGIFAIGVNGLSYKLFLAIEVGVLITAGTLPLVILIVFFSKTYIFSILLCVFYSVLNLSATALVNDLPKFILWVLPTPLTTFWTAREAVKHGFNINIDQLFDLIPSTLEAVVILGIMSLISIFIIDSLYRLRRD